jgi:hypothetical protein
MSRARTARAAAAASIAISSAGRSAVPWSRSGSPFLVTTGIDNAPNGQANNQRPNLVGDPFMASRTFGQRSLRIGLRQVQLRLEAFNLLNTVNPDNPVATMNSPDFGKITQLAPGLAPRILQLAVKYLF